MFTNNELFFRSDDQPLSYANQEGPLEVDKQQQSKMMSQYQSIDRDSVIPSNNTSEATRFKRPQKKRGMQTTSATISSNDMATMVGLTIIPF